MFGSDGEPHMRCDLKGEGWEQKILREINVDGGKAQVVENKFSRGARAFHFEPDLVLRWRICPDSSYIRGWQHNPRLFSVGRMMLVPANIEAGVVARRDEASTSLILRIKPQWFEEVTGMNMLTVSGSVHQLMRLQNNQLEHSVRRIAQEIGYGSTPHKTVIDACMCLICIDLARHFTTARKILTKAPFNSHRLREIRNLICSATDNVPTITEVALNLGLTRKYLSRAFVESTGLTLQELIMHTRIDKAKNLLRETREPIKVIAYRTGFCSPSAFSQAFRHETGFTPTAFRTR